MINVSQLQSSQINREISELKTRSVPLTFRRFSDPFKIPDNTALLQALLLAQTGRTREIPNIIKSTTNSAFSKSINAMKDNPTILNNISLTHDTVDFPTIGENKIPELKNNMFKSTTSNISGELNPTGITKSLNPVNNEPMDLIPTKINELNIKNRLHLGHINQKTIFNPLIDIEKETKLIQNKNNKLNNINEEIEGLNKLLALSFTMPEYEMNAYNTKQKNLTIMKSLLQKSISKSNERITKLNRGLDNTKSNIEKKKIKN